MQSGEPSSNSRKAKLSLRFVIVGASVAGLSCAYALRQAGHDVVVFEASKELGWSPGGVRIPPNMSRILVSWGLGREMVKLAGGRCPKIVFHSASQGDQFGELIFHKELMRQLEGEIYLMHHQDLLNMLYRIALEAGAEINFGCPIASVNSEEASVTLSNGKKVYGDLIVGADGDKSITRRAVDGGDEEDDDDIFTTYIYTVTRSQMGNDKDLLELLEQPLWRLWSGLNWSLLGHPAQDGAAYAITVYKKEWNTDASRGWTQSVPIDKAIPPLHGLEPRLRRLFALTKTAVQTKHVVQQPLDSWSDERGHVVLVGDAAHVLNPNSCHSAALAMEDAVVLGTIFSRLSTRDHIIPFLGAYQELRQHRCQAVRISEVEKMAFLMLPAGPERDARDASMRAELDRGEVDWTEADEGALRRQWEEFRDDFGYNAYEAADTWWVEWGVLFERVNAATSTSSMNTFTQEIYVERQEAVH